MEAGTKLFPAVFVKPTASYMFQFEFGRIKVEKPLIIYLFVVKDIRRCKCFYTLVRLPPSYIQTLYLRNLDELLLTYWVSY